MTAMSSHPATPASSSSAQKKRTRRVLQACENCRRKKTRCPGERPRCSTCSRLGQSCRYPVLDSHGEDTLGQQLGHSPVVPGGDGFGQGLYIRRLEDRLARLEAKLDARSDGGQDKTADGSRSSEPPRRADSTQPDHDDGSGRPSSTPLVAAAPGSPSRAASPAISSHIKTGTPLLPSRRVIAEAIRVYFRCSHRQPVWLFEPKSSLSVSSSHAVLLCVLALSTQHSPEVFAALGDEAPLKSPGEYNDAARRAILQSIGNAAVDLATLQALCLLSFSNLVRGDVQLASFHVSLASNLMHCAGLDTHRSTDRTLALENERRLYWSVQMVAALCGAPLKIPSTYSISAPSFVLPVETNATARRNTADTQPAPLLPLDPPSIGIRRPPGNSSTAAATADRAVSPNITSIWLHMVRSASLWGLVRAYLWRCHHEQQRPSASLQSGQDQRAPWHPDADYTAIHAQLFDMEGAFPVSFRYDASRFMERPLDELLRHRDFWLPWMKIQVTYHTIHAVLNHPFLYSPRVSQARPGGPNSFWKTSTDLALLHSTWIARILGMAHKKGLPLADPFFVYAASVAITLHVYWSRASDPSIRTAAEKYIDVCRAFIADLAVHWPLCKNMVSGHDDGEFLSQGLDGEGGRGGVVKMYWPNLNLTNIDQGTRRGATHGAVGCLKTTTREHNKHSISAAACTANVDDHAGRQRVADLAHPRLCWLPAAQRAHGPELVSAISAGKPAAAGSESSAHGPRRPADGVAAQGLSNVDGRLCWTA